MVADIVDQAMTEDGNGVVLDTLLFGGCPAPQTLPKKVKKAFPNTVLSVCRHHEVKPLDSVVTSCRSQAYGMTETNSIALGIAGGDYEAHPTSACVAT